MFPWIVLHSMWTGWTKCVFYFHIRSMVFVCSKQFSWYRFCVYFMPYTNTQTYKENSKDNIWRETELLTVTTNRDDFECVWVNERAQWQPIEVNEIHWKLLAWIGIFRIYQFYYVSCDGVFWYVLDWRRCVLMRFITSPFSHG